MPYPPCRGRQNQRHGVYTTGIVEETDPNSTAAVRDRESSVGAAPTTTLRGRVHETGKWGIPVGTVITSIFGEQCMS